MTKSSIFSSEVADPFDACAHAVSVKKKQKYVRGLIYILGGLLCFVKLDGYEHEYNYTTASSDPGFA